MIWFNKLARLLIACFLFGTAHAQDTEVKSGVYYDHLSGTDQEETMLDGATTFFDYFVVKAVGVKPGASFKRKIPKLEALVIVKEGQLKITLGGNTKTMGPGSVVFLIPGGAPKLENGGNEALKFYLLEFTSKLPMNQDRAITNGGSFFIDWNNVQSKDTGRGNRRDFFNRPTASCSKYEMHVTTLNEGLASHLPHTHSEEEIILLLKGEVNMEIDGKLLPATPGALIFLPSKVPHALHNTGKGACQYFAFQWKNEG